MVSYLHHLFTPETCPSYLHTLRWKDRSRQWPRGPRHKVEPWGTYHAQRGLQRDCCKEQGCQRTFHDLTDMLLDGSRRSVMHWVLAILLRCLSCASRPMAREVGVQSRTNSRWCWWRRTATLSSEMPRQLEGPGEAEDLYHTAGTKGQAHGGGTKSLGRRARGRRQQHEPGRGPYDKDQPAILAWVSGNGCDTGDPRLPRQDSAEGRRRGGARGQSALHGLRQQLSGTQGLCARVRQSPTERGRTWGWTREPGGVSVLLTQTVSASVSWPQQVQPAGVCRVLAVPAQRSPAPCLRAGEADLTGGFRPNECPQSQKGTMCPMF
jgi:hypothetical protein